MYVHVHVCESAHCGTCKCKSLCVFSHFLAAIVTCKCTYMYTCIHDMLASMGFLRVSFFHEVTKNVALT